MEQLETLRAASAAFFRCNSICKYFCTMREPIPITEITIRLSLQKVLNGIKRIIRPQTPFKHAGATISVQTTHNATYNKKRMKTSETGLQLIKHYEGIHDGDLTKIGLQPKLCPAGVWTVGYGHALGKGSLEEIAKKYPNLMTITEKEAEALLAKDLPRYEAIVHKNTKGLKQHEFDALVSHTYNTGGSETLFRLVNERGNIKDWWLSTYITAGGVKLNGLVKRREAEWHLFETGKNISFV